MSEKYLDKHQRFATSAKTKKMYDELEDSGLFKDHTQLFLTGLAVGILTGTKSQEPATVDIIKMDTYVENDEDGVFPIYLLAENPDLSPKQLAKLMEAYADAGVSILYDEYRKTNNVNFIRLSELGDK